LLNARNVAVEGNYAFVIDDSGLQVIDISNPLLPSLVDRAELPPFADANDLAIAGGFAYLAGMHRGLQVVDVSAPQSPRLVGAAETHGIAWGIALLGSHAYLADGSRGLAVVDITQSNSPAPIGGVDLLSYGHAVALAGDLMYVANSYRGLQIVDVANITSPVLLGSLDTLGEAFDVEVVGDYAYVADAEDGLLVVDVSNPNAPAIVGQVDMPGEARSVAVQGSRAFVADHDQGLQIVDVSDAAKPTIIGSVDTYGYAADVDVEGALACVADWHGGLEVIDVGDPSAPLVIGRVWNPGVDYPSGVVMDGEWAYVAGANFATDSGLFQAINLADPKAPYVAGEVLDVMQSGKVAVRGTHAYVADGTLRVIDISNPVEPAIVGAVSPPDLAQALAIDDRGAFVIDSSADIRIYPLQCSTPQAVALSQFDAQPVTLGILLTWSTAFESNHLGFHVHRSTDAEGGYRRVSVELIEPPGPYRFLDTDVRPGATYFYRLEALDRSGGSEFHGPVQATAGTGSRSARFTLSQSQPNPFVAEQGATAIGFTLGQQVHTKLRVFDASGRLVRVLIDDPLSAGPHAALWDGRNDGGGETGAGIYYYRLEAGQFSDARALVRLK
jgi:hypothetical protein